MKPEDGFLQYDKPYNSMLSSALILANICVRKGCALVMHLLQTAGAKYLLPGTEVADYMRKQFLEASDCFKG